jgi:hypothetical protein
MAVSPVSGRITRKGPEGIPGDREWYGGTLACRRSRAVASLVLRFCPNPFGFARGQVVAGFIRFMPAPKRRRIVPLAGLRPFLPIY